MITLILILRSDVVTWWSQVVELSSLGPAETKTTPLQHQWGLKIVKADGLTLKTQSAVTKILSTII